MNLRRAFNEKQGEIKFKFGDDDSGGSDENENYFQSWIMRNRDNP